VVQSTQQAKTPYPKNKLLKIEMGEQEVFVQRSQKSKLLVKDVDNFGTNASKRNRSHEDEGCWENFFYPSISFIDAMSSGS
jgi:hypothetical protein